MDELKWVPWERLPTLLPGKAFDPDQTAVNNRLVFVNGVFWALAPAPTGAICLTFLFSALRFFRDHG